jgi:hypothetical protein
LDHGRNGKDQAHHDDEVALLHQKIIDWRLQFVCVFLNPALKVNGRRDRHFV